MKIKTSELTDAALDWAVLEAQKPELAHPERGRISCFGPLFGKGYMYPSWGTRKYPPSTDWAQGGPIIEREHIGFEWMVSEWWVAGQNYGGHPYKDRPDLRPIGTRFMSYGPTALIAAMRCYVASKLGDEVDIPEELML